MSRRTSGRTYRAMRNASSRLAHLMEQAKRRPIPPRDTDREDHEQ